MKKRLYIYCLWVATLSVLLTTIVMHHHHESRICMVEERCPQDNAVNDEHTEHHDKEQEGCSVRQMHNFIINAKVVNNIEKHILDGGSLPVAVLPTVAVLSPCYGLTVSTWQEHTEPLSAGSSPQTSRRGPPMFS